MDGEGDITLPALARAARRLQLVTSLAPGRGRRRAVAREGQAVLEALWRLGFRPRGGEG